MKYSVKIAEVWNVIVEANDDTDAKVKGSKKVSEMRQWGIIDENATFERHIETSIIEEEKPDE